MMCEEEKKIIQSSSSFSSERRGRNAKNAKGESSKVPSPVCSVDGRTNAKKKEKMIASGRLSAFLGTELFLSRKISSKVSLLSREPNKEQPQLWRDFGLMLNGI